MNKQIELLIQKKVLRDVEIGMLEQQRDGMIISELVVKDILKSLEDNYSKESHE